MTDSIEGARAAAFFPFTADELARVQVLVLVEAEAEARVLNACIDEAEKDYAESREDYGVVQWARGFARGYK